MTDTLELRNRAEAGKTKARRRSTSASSARAPAQDAMSIDQQPAQDAMSIDQQVDDSESVAPVASGSKTQQVEAPARVDVVDFLRIGSTSTITLPRLKAYIRSDSSVLAGTGQGLTATTKTLVHAVNTLIDWVIREDHLSEDQVRPRMIEKIKKQKA